MGENIYRIFDGVWNLSLVGGYCVLLVLLARLLLQKAPKWCSYLLWGIVFVRLCCPVLPETGISLIPERLLSVGTEMMSGQQTTGADHRDLTEGNAMKNNGDALWREHAAEEVPDSHAAEKTMAVGNDNTVMNADGTQDFSLGTARTESGATVAGVAASGTDAVISETSAGTGTDARAWTYPVWFRVLSMVWLAGMLVFLGYHAYSYLRMRNRIHRPDSGVRQVEPGICEIDGGHLSFVMGLIHPVIYLSSGLDPESRKVVLCHERVHLQRRDYLFKPAALVICCVHWFNPLVWLAFYLMNMDCEMSCDEKVVKLLGEESKKIYSYTLLEEASGGEWKRYRGGSICALLSFGEDHVKNRIRHVLDYRKPPFWVMIGAAAVLVILVVCLCSNPGGKVDMTDGSNPGTTTETADSGAETEPEENGVGSVVTPEEFAGITIHNREEFGNIFSLKTIEAQRSFQWDNTAHDLVWAENNGDYVYGIFKALLDGNTSQEYKKYTDPVTSAVTLLHLGEGNGTVTETLYKAKQQFNFSDTPGEGSVVNVRYTFAADASFIDIPMVMAEETQRLWFLSFGDLSSSGDPDKTYGPLEGDICTRNVYAEYELSDAGQYPFPEGSYIGEDNIGERQHIQVSSYGIYLMDEQDNSFGCIHAERIPAKVPADVTCVPIAYRTSESGVYNGYRADRGLTDNSDIRVYYLTDPDESHFGSDAWMPTVLREYDLDTGTITDRALPENLQIGNGLWVGEGYYYIENSSNPAITIRLPLTGVGSLYGSYAAARGADTLAYPGVVFDVSNRTEDETFALLDLDGDGISEKISIHPAEQVTGYSFEEYMICVNLGLGQMNCYDLQDAVLEIDGQTAEIPDSTGNMSNSIFAFSPDGEQILIALYEDGPSADPLTRLYHYENGKLVETGQIKQDIRRIQISHGQMQVHEPYNVMTIDSIERIYYVTKNGHLQEVPQEEYWLSGYAEVELLQDMTLYRTPNGETFILPAGSKVRMTKLDATQNWICLQTEDNTQGWFRLEAGINYDDYFGGLNHAD
mgnify:FL=1